MVTVTRARLRADRRPWAQARSLADLGELTAQWLEGRIVHQPAYCDPRPGEQPGPDPETCELVPVLAASNRAGFVTACSQPGEAGDGWEQRAAVEGFCDAAAAAKLGSSARAAGLIVVAHDPALLPARRMRFGQSVPVTREDGRTFTRFGAQLSRAHLRDAHVGYGECHRDAVDALCGAWQVTLIEPEWGRNAKLWPVLERFAGVSP